MQTLRWFIVEPIRIRFDYQLHSKNYSFAYQMQMQSEERMQSFGLHFLDERMQKPFLLGGIVTKSSLFYYSLCINAKMQREKNTQRRTSRLERVDRTGKFVYLETVPT